MARCVRSLRVLCADRTCCTHRTCRTHCTQLRFHAHPAGRLFPLRRAGWGSAEARCRRSRRARGRAARHSSSTGPISASTTSRSSIPRRIASSTRAGLRRFTASGKRRRSSGRTIARFTNRCGFPWPGAPVRVAIKKRDRQNVFEPLWDVDVDPHSASRADARLTARAERLSALFESGPPSRKVDLLLISDGYSLAQAAKFRADATRLVNALFAHEPFKSRRADFNVRALLTVPGIAAVGRVQHLRPRAVRADLRQSRASQRRRGRALRRRRDPGERERSTAEAGFSISNRR